MTPSLAAHLLTVGASWSDQGEESRLEPATRLLRPRAKMQLAREGAPLRFTANVELIVGTPVLLKIGPVPQFSFHAHGLVLKPLGGVPFQAAAFGGRQKCETFVPVNAIGNCIPRPWPTR